MANHKQHSQNQTKQVPPPPPIRCYLNHKQVAGINVPPPSPPLKRIVCEDVKMPTITWKTLLWFGFCCLCLGVGVGGHFFSL